MQHRYPLLTAFAIAIAFGCGAAHAQATIDQSKALAGNITPGDTPGFPITLSVPGSYKLTGNLVVPAGLSGIHVSATGVTLDLNGFNITGPVTCTRNEASYAVVCSNILVNTWGVELSGGGNTVRNGAIRGFAAGVRYFGGDQIEGMLVEHNAGWGILGANSDGARTVVRNVRAQMNGLDGMAAADAFILNASVGSNGRHGISGGRSTVVDSVVFMNAQMGVNGNNITVGRTMSSGNKQGDFSPINSMGGNIKGSSSQAF